MYTILGLRHEITDFIIQENDASGQVCLTARNHRQVFSHLRPHAHQPEDKSIPTFIFIFWPRAIPQHRASILVSISTDNTNV